VKLKFPQDLAIIDDDPTTIAFAKQVLKSVTSFNVCTYTDSEEAFQDIRNKKIQFVITDIHLPGVMGDELIARFRKLPFGVTTAVISGTDNFTTALRCFKLGADVYTKPATKNMYKEIVRQFHNRIYRWNSSIEVILKNKEESRKQHSKAQSATAGKSRQTILFVDDDEYLREAVASSLGQHYQVRLASNGQEALGMAEGVSLVITDINMPEMDGFEFIANLELQENYQTPVIVTSGFLHKKLRFNDLVKQVIEKPFNAEELLTYASAILKATEGRKSA